MRDFKIITGYELKQQLGKKSVRVTTIILMLAALIAASFPRVSQMVKGDVPAGGTAQEAAQTAGQDDYMSLETGYVFGAHLNYDANADADEVIANLPRFGDNHLPQPFRRYARLWLPQDYDDAARRGGNAKGETGGDFSGLQAEIDAAYAEALPKLVAIGVAPTVQWAHEKLGIPQAQDGEAVLRVVKAKAGGVVVIDAKSGEVLALANAPTYNPNNRVKLTGDQLRNRALTDTYEPGSTMKPFTAALALEKGKVTANTIINCAPGRMTIGSATISDAHPHGALSVTQVIQKSSNIGAAKMALSFPPETMWKMFDDLGFGSPLKLGFPGEVGGRLRPAKNWRPIEQATMSYGHGMSVNLMQMANAYQVFARDGDIVPLSLSRVDTPPVHGTRVFSPQTAREVRQMLETVVQPGGTAQQANVPGYRVGGKTGTSMKLVGGHYANRYVASFVGIAPISDPRLIVAVMIDEPSNGKRYGGEVAAPVFAQVTGGALRTLGVAPDAPLKPLQVARGAAAPVVREAM